MISKRSDNKKMTDAESISLRKKILRIILALIFFISLVLSALAFFMEKNDTVAFIYSDNKLMYKINLHTVAEPYQIRVDSPNGGYNIIEVKKDSIGVTDASCPDKICQKTGFTHSSSTPVICLPNKLVIKIKSSSPDTDLTI